MDSLTQLTLGAAVGLAIGGKKYGRKSALIGAICGTIPDLDTFLFIAADPVTSFTYHRGFSHSFLFTIMATPLLAYIFSKIKWFNVTFKDKRLHISIFLILLTHILLDALTIYGTQLFWPLPIEPVGIGSIFIIDPLYTLPLLFGVLASLLVKSTKILNISLIATTLYLVWGLGVQQHIKSFIPREENQKILVQTTPFNSFLWRIVIMTNDGYKIGYYSIFDHDKDINFKEYKNDIVINAPLSQSKDVKRLTWFKKGFYQTELIDNKIIMTDIRMGLEPDNYIFGFIVGENKNNEITAVPNQQYRRPREMGALSQIWQRIWNKDIDI